jgi:hypothetical protein
MLSNQQLVNEVDRILWEDWDPIGVNDEPAARNEYNSYAAAIAHLFQAGADETQIARYLKSIEDHQSLSACMTTVVSASRAYS